MTSVIVSASDVRGFDHFSVASNAINKFRKRWGKKEKKISYAMIL